MKTSKTHEFHRPFKALNKLLKSKTAQTEPSKIQKPFQKQNPIQNAEDSEQLFQEAMAGVKPISGKKHFTRQKQMVIPPLPAQDEDSDIIKQLNDLIESGQGFVVANTPEYMEGGGISTHPEINRRLHRGDFSIQGYVDLHGLGVNEAREELEAFLKDAVRTAKRAVLIVHGRGLSSPGRPVLKTKVYEWLTRGPWRKWVIAFTSAKAHDGGAGATYVLLRRRPLTRRQRKRKG